MRMTDATTRLLIALFLVLGTLAIIILLAFKTIPDNNREMVLGLLGSWATVVALMAKRLFEGSESSDKKNEIMASQAAALAGKDAAPSGAGASA